MARKPSNPLYEKLSPKTLSSMGLSAKSELYRNISTGQTISKRQYQKTLETRQGKSNEKIAKEYREDTRTYAKPSQAKAAKGRTIQSSAQSNLKFYISELEKYKKRYNLNRLTDAFKGNKLAWKKINKRDLEILASSPWGESHEMNDLLETDLDEVYDDEDDMPDDLLTPFYYH